MNAKFAQTKSRVNPLQQTIITMILCVLSTIALIISLMFFEFFKGGAAFVFERFVIYAILPVFMFIPFIRIGKTIKIIPAVIGTSVGSMAFVMVIFPVQLILPVFVSSVSVIFAGYYVHKWSKQWNQQFGE